MSSKYLLTCQCGQPTEIEPSQAGDFVVCACGKRLEIPTLRQMRHLPPAETPALTTAGSHWGARQGVLTLGVVLAALLAGLGGYVWANDPPAPTGFNPLETAKRIERGLDQMTPAQGYQQWVQAYQPFRQINELTNPRERMIRDELAKRRVIRWSLWGAAALALCVGTGLSAAMPARPST